MHILHALIHSFQSCYDKFHDINGNTTHGVAITVREVVNLPNQFVSDIKSLRLKRKYVDKITSAWSSHKLCQENIELNEAVKGNLTKAVNRQSKRLLSDSVNNEEAYQEGQQHPSFKRTILEPINHNSNERIKKPTSQLASKLAAESYKQMIDNFELGDICIVEQCYILLGTKPEHNSLLLSALLNLVNFEAPVSIFIFRLRLLYSSLQFYQLSFLVKARFYF